MKRAVVLIAVLGICAGMVTSVGADSQIEPEKAAYMAAHPEGDPSGPSVRILDEPIATEPKATRAIGTITYDDGIVTAFPTTTSYCYGNRFNTFTGNPAMANGVVNTLSFFMASGAGTDNVFVSVYGPVNTTAGTAPFIDDHSVVLTAGSNAWNVAVLPTAASYTGASFLAGVWYVAGDTVGLGSGTVGGQGHHGMIINDVVGTGYMPLPTVNALVRPTGDILPVELMSFTIQ